MKVVVITFAPSMIDAFYQDHIELIKNLNNDVIIVSTSDTVRSQQKFVKITGKRSISFLDILSLVQILFILFRYRPHALITLGPKAGLIAQVAGFICRIRVRLHFVTGQVWATKTGLYRKLLILLEWLTWKSVTHTLIDGRSQKAFLNSNGLYTDEKSKVIGYGAIKGVPLVDCRKKFDNLDLLYVGRINKDKGIDSLFSLMDNLASVEPRIRLLLVGANENYKLEQRSNIKYLGYREDVYSIMCNSFLLIQPSYREGFGMTCIEASACGLPIVNRDIYGLKDSCISGYNSLSFKTDEELVSQVTQLMKNKSLYDRLSLNGKEFVRENFSLELIQSNYFKYYRDEIFNH